MNEIQTRSSLLRRISTGADEMAWVEFHATYSDLIRRVARRRGLQSADIDDAVQEVYVRLGRAMPGFEYDRDRGYFRGYLKRVVISVILDRFRQNRVAETVPLIENADGGAEFDALWESEWRAHHVQRAMQRIAVEFGERDRLAFHHVTANCRSAQDVAKELELSVDQVYQAKSRILRRLGAIVAEQVEAEG